MDKKFNQIYYSDEGYWRGKSAIQKLAIASGSTKEGAEKWLLKQPFYQIYLPPPKYVQGPMQVRLYLLNQMTFIKQTFSICHMTGSRRNMHVCSKCC